MGNNFNSHNNIKGVKKICPEILNKKANNLIFPKLDSYK